MVEHHGEHYQIPSRTRRTGLGKPLKLMARPLRADIPIYLASLGPKAVELAFEIADGWLPIYFSPEKARRSSATCARRLRRSAGVQVRLRRAEDGIDLLKPYYAFYIGGMGSRGKNFYNDLLARFGYEAEARRAGAFLDGQQRDAAALMPDAFVDEVALVGPQERIADRLDAWRECGATTLLLPTRHPAAIRALPELVL